MIYFYRSIKVFFSKDRDFYNSIKGILGYYPRNISLYKLAFTHRSITQKSGNPEFNNERLEFLGDSIIESITSDYLYQTYPGEREGFLTQIRSKIVGRANLSYLAKQIYLENLIKAQLYNQQSKNLPGNALEALVGAMYLDIGYKKTKKIFLSRILLPNIDINGITTLESDYKSRLIELAQKNGGYVFFDTFEKPQQNSKALSFICFIRINGEAYGDGEGFSKKEAEQHAAKEAYKKYIKKVESEQHINSK